MQVPRPNRIRTSAAGNKYFRIKINGSTKFVTLDQDILDAWDDINELIIENVDYEKTSATQKHVDDGLAEEVGELIDMPFSRLEITDYVSYSRDIKVREHEIMLDNLVVTKSKKPVSAAVLAEAVGL